MGKFVICQGKRGYWFCLCSGNGQVVAASELYTTRESCRSGIDCIRRDCQGGVEDLTISPTPAQRCPKFEIFLDRAGEFRFRLKSKNGEIIVVSEGYKTKASCKKGIASVRQNAPDAALQDHT